MVAEEAAGGTLNSVPIINPGIPRRIVLAKPASTRSTGAVRMVAELLEEAV